MDEETYQLALKLRDKLRAELASNDTFRAFQHAEAMLAIWDRNRARPEATVASQPQPQARTGGSRVAGTHMPGSRTSHIVNAAADYLRQKGSPATSGEILKELTARGISVGGKHLGKTTSSYLSHSPLFDNKPGQGYGLVEWSMGDKKDDDVGLRSARWTAGAEEYLRTKGARAESGEIQNALVRDGIMPSGDKPRQHLTAYLSSKKEKFDNIRGQGYGLTEWRDPDQTSEAPDSGELSGAPRTNGALSLGL